MALLRLARWRGPWSSHSTVFYEPRGSHTGHVRFLASHRWWIFATTFAYGLMSAFWQVGRWTYYLLTVQRWCGRWWPNHLRRRMRDSSSIFGSSHFRRSPSVWRTTYTSCIEQSSWKVSLCVCKKITFPRGCTDRKYRYRDNEKQNSNAERAIIVKWEFPVGNGGVTGDRKKQLTQGWKLICNSM